MPVNLSIKNVPDEIAEDLRERAARNHRSLQGELLAIIEEAAGGKIPLSPSDFLAGVRLSAADAGRIPLDGKRGQGCPLKWWMHQRWGLWFWGAWGGNGGRPAFQVHAGGAAVAVVRIGQYRVKKRRQTPRPDRPIEQPSKWPADWP